MTRGGLISFNYGNFYNLVRGRLGTAIQGGFANCVSTGGSTVLRVVTWIIEALLSVSLAALQFIFITEEKKDFGYI